MPGTFLQKVLLVLDATEPSQAAIDTALGLASQVRAEKLHVAFIIDMDTLGSLLDMHVFVKDEMDEMIEDFEVQGKKLFKAIRARAEKLEVTIDPALCQGRFYQVVLQCIKQFKADAIVMGGWGENMGSHKDHASIERQLAMEQSPVPVFIVK